MKIAITAAVLSLALAFSAGAAEYHAPLGLQVGGLQVAGKQVARDGYACERGPVNRVALTAPAPCCAGQLVCSQFLSTNTMVRAPASNRT